MGDLSYTYDAAGNRTKVGSAFACATIPPALSTVSYNVNNQQTTFGTNTETYDLNGNLSTVTKPSGTATYTWNTRNQLTGISTTGFSASFTYDSFGRRTGKTVQGVTTNIVYDGLNPVQEKAGATVMANLVTGLGIDEFLNRTDGVGSRARLPDALGSTVALGDSTGTLQTQYTYEPFGYATQTGQANTNSYKYTGREDDGSGLYYYRARYYHPRLQRFIAEDPIKFAAGSTNFYAYVGGNPMNANDPLGLRPLTYCEKSMLALYIPQTDLDNADIHEEGTPWWTRNDAEAVTLGNDIYFKSKAYSPFTPSGLALLGHELIHVGQFRQGMTYLDYIAESILHGTGMKNRYEIPAYRMQSGVENDLTNQFGAREICGCVEQ